MDHTHALTVGRAEASSSPYESGPRASVGSVGHVRGTHSPCDRRIPYMATFLECPRQDSNLRTRLRRAVLYPLSYGGSATAKGYQERAVRPAPPAT